MDPSKLTEKYARDLFAQYGHILDIDIPRKPDGTNKGFAFIKFKQEEDKNFCLKHMDGIEDVRDALKPKKEGKP